MNNIISAKDMCLWYGEHQALKNVNIDIPEKSITAFIGPSGCGKSTFLKTLNRMNDLIPGVKITGDIRYENNDIFSKEVDVNHLRKEIGMVFQKPNPFPMSIYDNVAYGPRTHGITNKIQLDEIVENALRDAAIWDEVKESLKKKVQSPCVNILRKSFPLHKSSSFSASKKIFPSLFSRLRMKLHRRLCLKQSWANLHRFSKSFLTRSSLTWASARSFSTVSVFRAL